MARHGVKEISSFFPTDQKIWFLLRNKDISRNIHAYLWKCMHNVHRYGTFWAKIPSYEQRATCRVCGCQYFTLPRLFHMESMEWRVEADGFHVDSMDWLMDSISFHGISRWIPYCLSQTSCHLKIPYKTHM